MRDLVAPLARASSRLLVERDDGVRDVVVVDLADVGHVAPRPARIVVLERRLGPAPACAGAAAARRRSWYSSSSMRDKPTAADARPAASSSRPAPPPCAASSSLARLNGREPKNPRLADSGLGCARLDRPAWLPSSGRRLAASRPHRIATSGAPARDERADRVLGDLLPALAAMGCRRARPHGQHPVQQHDALLAPRREVAVRRRRDAEVVVELLVDVREAARQRVARAARRRTRARSDAPASGTGPGRR